MSYCQLCKSPTRRALILCSMCTSPWAEREIGRQIKPLLELLKPAEVIAQTRQILPPIIGLKHFEYQETDPTLSLGKQVRRRENRWKESRQYETQFINLKNDMGPIDTFPGIMLVAIVGRRCYRQYLRRRFKFDPIRIQFFKDGGYPSSPRDERLWRLAWQHFVLYETMFDLCTNILFVSSQRWKEPAKGTELREAIIEAVSAVERLVESYPLIVAQGMSFPSQVIQQEATLLTAAWAKMRTNLGVNLRLADRLSEDGTVPYDKLHDKLREELPSNTFQAYHNTDWQTLQELTTRILYFVEHNGSEPHPEQRIDIDPYQHNLAEQIRLDPAHQLEIEDLLNFVCQQAGLTDYEETVWLLKGEGYEDKEIAEQLDRTVDGVKQAWSRAKKKLSKMVNE